MQLAFHIYISHIRLKIGDGHKLLLQGVVPISTEDAFSFSNLENQSTFLFSLNIYNHILCSFRDIRLFVA